MQTNRVNLPHDDVYFNLTKIAIAQSNDFNLMKSVHCIAMRARVWIIMLFFCFALANTLYWSRVCVCVWSVESWKVKVKKLSITGSAAHTNNANHQHNTTQHKRANLKCTRVNGRVCVRARPLIWSVRAQASKTSEQATTIGNCFAECFVNSHWMNVVYCGAFGIHKSHTAAHRCIIVCIRYFDIYWHMSFVRRLAEIERDVYTTTSGACILSSVESRREWERERDQRVCCACVSTRSRCASRYCCHFIYISLCRTYAQHEHFLEMRQPVACVTWLQIPMCVHIWVAFILELDIWEEKDIWRMH